MTTCLDHITVVASSLEVGSSLVRESLGVEPHTGRAHPSMGTHNRLLRLGDTVYLEVIAVDPHAPPPSRPRWFGLDRVHSATPPRLAAWVASTDDIVRVAAPELGVVETMRREHHAWQMTLTSDGQLPLSGAAPLLIQRAPGLHPARALPDAGLRLRRLRIHHPQAARVSALLATIGLACEPEVVVRHGDACALVAEIDTPWGPKALGQQ
ncbi:MAG TPA: VOC family protein [Burkholderiaceae bacterium]|nr:VOC family protein [Burkholderiaceae bacterium]